MVSIAQEGDFIVIINELVLVWSFQYSIDYKFARFCQKNMLGIFADDFQLVLDDNGKAYLHLKKIFASFSVRRRL